MNKITIFRIEDINGNGPFFFQSGMSKNYKVDFSDITPHHYAFADINSFNSDSYLSFYNSDEYILYEIEVKRCSITNKRNKHAIFFLEDIISKKQIQKKVFTNEKSN